MYVSNVLLFFIELRRRKLIYDIVNEFQRRKFNYDVVILIYAIAHVYVYQCACSAFTFLVLCIVNLIDISFLR